jgi:hypothetical protein
MSQTKGHPHSLPDPWTLLLDICLSAYIWPGWTSARTREVSWAVQFSLEWLCRRWRNFAKQRRWWRAQRIHS